MARRKPRIGTSIGSLVGAVYAGDNLAELEEWVTVLTWRKVVSYFDLSFGGGLLKGEKLFDHLRGGLLDGRIEDLKRPFAAVATELSNGREIWLREGLVADAVRASIAMPGLFTPYSRDDQLLEYHRAAESIAEGRAAAELAIPQLRRELQNLN